MSEDGQADAPLTEPVIQDCKFITGGTWEVSEGSIRLILWVELPHLTGSQARERRIVGRYAMTKLTGGDLNASLSEIMARREPRH